VCGALFDSFAGELWELFVAQLRLDGLVVKRRYRGAVFFGRSQ
jgi:hypothetical protein